MIEFLLVMFGMCLIFLPVLMIFSYLLLRVSKKTEFDCHIRKVKDKKGREQEVVYKLNADCKFAYDLTKINFDAKNGILTLPTCEVTVSPDYSGDGPKYISGGNGSYDIEVENQFKKKIKEEDIFEKLEKGQYDKKAFEHAKNLLTKMLKNFTDQNIKIVPNKEPMKLKKKRNP